MNLVNRTQMVVGYSMGMDPAGRQHVVVAVKGTFTIPKGGGSLRLAQGQLPLVLADTFTGEPGLSATVYEADLCMGKPYCDVLLNGSAWAPGGRPTTRTHVELRVGSIRKRFDVVGERTWRRRWLRGLRPSRAEPFSSMPISYDRAYGGIDDSDPECCQFYARNLAGVGYHPRRSRRAIQGQPVPNTEERSSPIRHVTGRYRPMSFGAVARGSPERVALAGTFDQQWSDEVFPFLPADFDPRYYQSAPMDQQMDHPRAGEVVELTNLTPEGKTVFRLPTTEIVFEFASVLGETAEKTGVLDTVVIEPDQNRVLLTWRALHPIRRNLLEVKRIVVAPMTRGWRRAKETGKEYRPLGHFRRPTEATRTD